MAKKSSRSGSNKHYPVQRVFRLAEESPQSNNQDMQIRIDHNLSMVNHRLYRQSRVYKVKVDLDANAPDQIGVDVYALNDTWMNQKAYQFAKEIFDRNSQEELAMGVKKARWNDFRVNHGVTCADLQPVLENGATAAAVLNTGEFPPTVITNASGNERQLQWVGSGAASFNIIDQYDLTANTDAAPDTPITAVAYDGMQDEVDDAQVEHLQTDGDLPPYDATSIENRVFTRIARLVVDQDGTSKLSTGFFNAPCGLIWLKGIDAASTSVTLDKLLTCTVQGGDYKGVHAPSYLE